jgi:signal transduction histidine kinase
MVVAKGKISPFIIVASWLLFSVALAVWWVVFAYRFISSVMLDRVAATADLPGMQRMLVYEGISLILCLLAGGGALAYYVVREHRRNLQMRQFFAAFTHDLKTPIASLRLQAESISEDFAGAGEAVLAKRLLGDTLRLELQLENSLFLANLDDLARLHAEDVRLSKMMERISAAWPELDVSLAKDASLRCDPRALETILKNLASNSFVHGKARSLSVSVEVVANGKLCLNIADDGTGYAGDLATAGSLFASRGARAGSGVGLYLVRSLAQKMGGRVHFSNRPGAKGFLVALELPGRLIE